MLKTLTRRFMRNPATYDPVTGNSAYRQPWIERAICKWVCVLATTLLFGSLGGGCTIVVPLGGNTQLHQHSYIVSSRNTDTSGSTNVVSTRVEGGARTAPNVGLNGDKAIAETADVAKGFLITPVAGQVIQGGAEALLKAKQIEAMGK